MRAAKVGTVVMAVGAALAVCLASAGPAHAGLVPIDLRSVADSTHINASSYYPGFNGDDIRYPYRASDGSGMIWAPSFPTGSHTNQQYYPYPLSAEWLTNDKSGSGTWIAWDLGASYTISKIHVWNSNQTGTLGRGVQKLYLQTDDGSHWPNPNTGWADALGHASSLIDWLNMPGDNSYGTITNSAAPGGIQATGLNTYTGFDWTLPAPITTRYLKFSDTTCFSGSGYTGLSEVVFFYDDSPPPTQGGGVPEPASLGLLLLGLPLLGLRKQRT